GQRAGGLQGAGWQGDEAGGLVVAANQVETAAMVQGESVDMAIGGQLVVSRQQHRIVGQRIAQLRRLIRCDARLAGEPGQRGFELGIRGAHLLGAAAMRLIMRTQARRRLASGSTASARWSIITPTSPREK